MDGATLEIVYSADTTDAATKSLDNGERIRQFFNAFTQTVSFTNRPNGRPDVGLTVDAGNDPVITNY